MKLLALRGMTGESFVEAACKIEEEYWEKYLESVPEGNKFLDTDRTLKVYIPFPSLAGETWCYHLCEF